MQALQSALPRLDHAAIGAAAVIVREALKRGGLLHAFGSGHSSLLAQEIFYRAGGLAAIRPILDVRLGFEPGALASSEFERSTEAAEELVAAAGFRTGDAGLVISNSGRNALPVEMALRMRGAGVQVIALTNLAQSRAATSRHPSGQRLFEVADAVVDNACPEGDAAVHIAGLPYRMGPLSTVLGATILHCLLLEAAAPLAAEGRPPAVFPSANVEGVTLADIHRIMAPLAGRIRYYRSTKEKWA